MSYGFAKLTKKFLQRALHEHEFALVFAAGPTKEIPAGASTSKTNAAFRLLPLASGSVARLIRGSTTNVGIRVLFDRFARISRQDML